MERGGRSPDERAAAREARERSRIAREQGVPLDEEQEERPEQQPEDEDWRPDMRSMSRYGGGSRLSNIDIYARRRIVAGLAVVALIVVLFLMLGGC